MLCELNPRLVLESDPDAGRRDWPWLNDENLDALERGCRHYLGEGEPVHEQQLHAMLATLAPLTIAEPVPTHSRDELCALANAQVVNVAWHQSFSLISTGNYY